MKVDNLTMRRLIIVKQLWEHGSTHRKEKTFIGNMLACHHFDLAIENFLKIIGTKLGGGIGKEMRFNNLWNEVNRVYAKECGENLPLKHEISGIRDARNLVQHNATVPSEVDLKRYESYTRTFLDHTLNQVFKKSLEDVKLSDVIINEKLKKYIEQANRLISKGKYDEGIKKLSLAFDYGKIIKVKDITGNYEFWPYSIRYNLNTWGSEFESIDLDTILNEIKEKFEVLMLRIDFKRYVKFKKFKYFTSQVIGKDELKLLSKSIPLSGEKEPITKEDAIFCYDLGYDTLSNLLGKTQNIT